MLKTLKIDQHITELPSGATSTSWPTEKQRNDREMMNKLLTTTTTMINLMVYMIIRKRY
jgi:hypothetical protein